MDNWVTEVSCDTQEFCSIKESAWLIPWWSWDLEMQGPHSECWHAIPSSATFETAELLAIKAHERVFHSGVKSTLTELRLQYKKFCRTDSQEVSFARDLRDSLIVPSIATLPCQWSTPVHLHWIDFTGPLYTKGANVPHVGDTGHSPWHCPASLHSLFHSMFKEVCRTKRTAY